MHVISPVALISVTFKVVADMSPVDVMSPVQVKFLQLRDMREYIYKGIEKYLSGNLRKLKYFWEKEMVRRQRKKEKERKEKK